ncbi:unnamed protein product [Rotaria socialis]|uniref:VWFA domain-containing protein n=3 Tax=Rotaria socialis TaxID=392032 RepID=A0A818I758_9BILA|nr:unnamed protein product [Rotaria socialis]
MYPHLQGSTNNKPTRDSMSAYEDFTHRYAINKNYATKLHQLRGYEFVFICDDSGSMKNPIVCKDFSSRQQEETTRWEQLKKIVSIVVDLASTLDPDGVDVYFLNRRPALNVRSSKELTNIFATPPNGMTPIVRVFRQVLQDKEKRIRERKLLVLLATDGIPTTEDGTPNAQELYQVLLSERIPIDRVPATIICCTDDQECMSYLNDWDRKIQNLDVVDNYEKEKQQILACQGKSFPFSFGDYVVKILLGGVDSWFDRLDEEKISLDNDRSSQH